MISNENSPSSSKSVFVAGATGYIGRHVVYELVEQGYHVVSFARELSGINGGNKPEQTQEILKGSDVRFGNICDLTSVIEQGFRGDRFIAVISCLASRTGSPADANRIDYQANQTLLTAARQCQIPQFILLSAICVQKPRLAFQFAKLRFEQTLIDSGINYSIVRPTAFFKSLAGQVASVKKGKPFIVFGNGILTACKPISEIDLASFLVDCIHDREKHRQILPIGGPGPAVTPLQQGRLLFELCQQKPRYRHVPVQLFTLIIALLTPLSWLVPALKDKIEFARIGQYYATESMLLLDEETGLYNEEMTPEHGAVTLKDFYSKMIHEGTAGQELGDHAMFSKNNDS